MSENPIGLVGGRLPGSPTAIIDIGSNSVRLVIFERLAVPPITLFNEKLLAGLGRGLAATGRLEDAAVNRALAAVSRFRLLCANANVEKLHVIATAAAREAANGKEFVAEIEKLLGTKVSVLSGREEANYAALGVLAGLWKPDGIVADMGGGSLELVNVHRQAVGTGATFALGGLRIAEEAGGRPTEAIRIAGKVLRRAAVLEGAKHRDLYLIGGTWRSLARLHMAENGYPLRIMQAYRISANEMRDFCERVIEIELDLAKNPHLREVSRSRRPLLPFGAAVLHQLIEHSGARDTVVSAYGVREGYLYSTLAPEVRESDPLLAGCRELAQLRARSVAHVDELTGWSDQLVSAIELDETESEQRLRLAACLLADIGWRSHPDHRGIASLTDITHAPLAGVDHAGRAFLGLTVYYRHAGLAEPDELPEERLYLSLIGERLKRRARILASAMRLAYVLSASMPGTLGACRISAGENGALKVHIPKCLAALDGERLRKRANHLTREIDRPVEIDVSG